MSDRAYVFQTVRVAKESTAGSAPATGFRQLRSMSINPQIKANIDVFRPQGFKAPTVAPLGREWMTAALRGKPLFNEIDYALSSVLARPTLGTAVADPTSGTAYTRTYSPANGSADAKETYTVELGDSVRPGRFSYGLITDWGVTLTRAAFDMTGTMMGQRYSDNITFGTVSATALADVPVLPSQFDILLASTYAGLGTAGNKLLRVLSYGWNIKNRYGPIWVVDSAQSSFAGDVELEPQIEVKLKVEADATGMALLTQLRDGSTRYIRASATGGTAVAGTAGTATYQLQWDTALKISGEPSTWSNEQGIYAIEWTFVGVNDTNLPFGTSWSTRNLLASL